MSIRVLVLNSLLSPLNTDTLDLGLDLQQTPTSSRGISANARAAACEMFREPIEIQTCTLEALPSSRLRSLRFNLSTVANNRRAQNLRSP